MDQKVRVGGVAELQPSDEGGKIYVFYLVTKVLFYHKPTLQSLADSLNQLRDRLIDLKINRLIIPKLGCNLDQLDWYQVRGLLSTTFNVETVITVCDPEYPEILQHRLAPLRVESRVFCATCNDAVDPRELLILPVDLDSASINATLDRCLSYFNLKDELIFNGVWAMLKKGQVMANFAASKKFIIWLKGEDDRYFCTLEIQIDETLSLGLRSSIWVFPKSEMDYYPGFCALVRSKLADNAQNL
uniref:O-acetyl-ADP-ribose deacetylase n=1 Tax=Schizaphis graminum TaxID=13262 RepID=A0A2S2PS56_SCHGA